MLNKDAENSNLGFASSKQKKEHYMARKRTNAVPELSKTINIRLPSNMDMAIREICKKHAVPISWFGRKSFELFLNQLNNQKHIFQEVSL
jgi:hypothetical protein